MSDIGPNQLLAAALAYASKGWRVFPVHGIAGGRCTCGKPCGRNAGKHPRIKGGFKAATNDPEVIRGWWTKSPDANVVIAPGGTVEAMDLDGEEGIKQFKDLVAHNKALPETLVARTGNGCHLYFRIPDDSPEVRSSQH